MDLTQQESKQDLKEEPQVKILEEVSFSSATSSNSQNSNSSSTSSPLIIKILSYNLFIRPPGIKNNSNDFKDHRLKLFLQEVAKWDIIGFQELFGSFSQRRDKFLEETKLKGFKYYVTNPKPKLGSTLVDGGLVIISKFPIIESDFVQFEKGIQSDALAAKGVLYAKIQINEFHTFHIFNTHLQASYNDKKSIQNSMRNEQIRSFQLNSLRDFMNSKTNQDNLPIILLGDFNVNGFHSDDPTQDSPEYQQMVKTLEKAFDPKYKLIDILKVCKNGHPPTVGVYTLVEGKKVPKEIHLTHKDDQAVRKRLDYIFWIIHKEYEKQIQDQFQASFELNCDVFPFFVEDDKVTQLSDHYAVGLEVIWK